MWFCTQNFTGVVNNHNCTLPINILNVRNTFKCTAVTLVQLVFSSPGELIEASKNRQTLVTDDR